MGDEDRRKRQLRFTTAIRVRKWRSMKRARYEAENEIQRAQDSSDNLSIGNVEDTDSRSTRDGLDSVDENRTASLILDVNLSERNDSSASSVSEYDAQQNRSTNSLPASDTSNVTNASDEDHQETTSATVSVSGRSETSSTVNSVWSDERSDSQISDVITITEIEQLREWAIENDIKHNHLDKLLAILRRRLLPDLPKSSKTFLKTSSAKYTIVEMEDSNGGEGEFVYFGLKKKFRKLRGC